MNKCSIGSLVLMKCLLENIFKALIVFFKLLCSLRYKWMNERMERWKGERKRSMEV